MRTLFAAAACWIVISSGVICADVIDLDSGAGLATNLPGVDTVTITPDPLWQSNNPRNPGDPNDTSAVWISDGETGYGDSEFQPYEGTTPVVTVLENFQSGQGLLQLNVWADDTADVILDGNYLAHAVFTQSICSGQPIGCRPQDDGQFSTLLNAGNHQLEFVMYQVGTGTDTTSNPFGLLFTGTAPAAAVPEPAQALPLGCVLIGLSLAFRRKWKTPHIGR
jgi:hypothetical protein